MILRPCMAKRDLLQVYKEATAAYSTAVTSLKDVIGISSKVDYDVIHKLAEIARERVLKTRETLNTHIAQHHC
jgi:hypothetical protein